MLLQFKNTRRKLMRVYFLLKIKSFSNILLLLFIIIRFGKTLGHNISNEKINCIFLFCLEIKKGINKKSPVIFLIVIDLKIKGVSK